MTSRIRFLCVFLLVSGCASSEIAVEDAAKRAVLLAARPVLEKIFYAEAPLAPSNRELFPLVKSLPGGAFNPRKYYRNQIGLSGGLVELPPGDYIIPVMTYCMKSSGASPSAHRYQLGKLSGRRAAIIHDLNAKALPRFSVEEVQTASWSIQNGLSFDEMYSGTKKIIETVIPEHRKELEKSFMKDFAEKWNGIAEKMSLPTFEDTTDQFLDGVGEVGAQIRAIRDFRSKLQYGGDYDNLKSIISLPGTSETPGTEAATLWSKLSENVYARFVTRGHYLEVGELQIRVASGKRAPKALKIGNAKIDLASLVADPGSGAIQPLSFSALAGLVAVDTIPARASPALIAAIIAAILADKFVDWDAFEKAVEKFGDSVRDLIQKGLQVLSEKHDALEKPLRNAGVIDQNTKDISKSLGGARNYEKPGGKEALEKDFNKLPGKAEKSSDPKVRFKDLPNGERAILREDSKSGGPTLEIQPQNGEKVRIKVRYR